MIKKIVSILLLGILMACGAAFAADTSPVEVSLHAFQVVANQGGKLAPTTEARPGDVIEYQVTYHNTGKQPARQVAATLPVPDGGMAYQDGSASPGAFQASVDGVHFSAPPLKREIVRDGHRVSESVPPAEYRFLRWNIGDLAPGQSQTVHARMRLAPAQDKQS